MILYPIGIVGIPPYPLDNPNFGSRTIAAPMAWRIGVAGISADWYYEEIRLIRYGGRM